MPSAGSTGMAPALALVLAACGGGTVDPEPTGYLPDPVTMGVNLPAAVPVMKVRVNGQTIERGVPIAGTIELFDDGGAATPVLSAPIAFVGTSIFPNCASQPTYDAEVTYLRDWIAARLLWLDGQAAAMPGDCP